jgi:uncharacterized membrane protein
MVVVTDRVEAPGPGVSARRPAVWPLATVAAATVAFTFVFSLLVLHRHAHFGTRAFDLAIFDQGLWLLSQGETPFVTVRGLHLFADHTSFLLYPLVPLYWVGADVRALLVLSVAALAAGGPLVYLAARGEGLGRRWAAALAVMYLGLPAVHWQVWDAFHPETLAVPLLLAAYVLAQRRRPAWALVVLTLVLLAKEDAALVVVPLAVYLGVRMKSRWFAVGGAALGAAAMALSFGLLLPHWSPTGALLYTGRYRDFGDSLPEILWGVATSLDAVVASSFDLQGLEYLAGLVVPAAVALAAPGVLALAGPTLLANLVSRHTYQADIQYHYTAYIIPVVAIAAVVGCRRLLERSRQWSPRSRRVAATSVLLALAIGSGIAGPWGFGRRNPWAGRVSDPGAVTAALGVIPTDARVATDSRFAPHLAHRRTLYVFPNPVVNRNWSVPGGPSPPRGDFDWLVIRVDQSGLDGVFRWEADRLIRSGVFVPVVETDEVVVLQRSGDPPLPGR